MNLVGMIPVIFGIVAMIYLRHNWYLTSQSKFGDLMREGIGMSSLQNGGYIGFIAWIVLWWVIADMIRLPMLYGFAYIIPAEYMFIGTFSTIAGSIIIADIVATIILAIASRFMR